MTIDAILQKETLTHSDLVTLLGTTDAGQRKKLYDAAYAVKLKYIGNVDHYRGLLEFPIAVSRIANTAASAGIMKRWNALTRLMKIFLPWPNGLMMSVTDR